MADRKLEMCKGNIANRPWEKNHERKEYWLNFFWKTSTIEFQSIKLKALRFFEFQKQLNIDRFLMKLTQSEKTG